MGAAWKRHAMCESALKLSECSSAICRPERLKLKLSECSSALLLIMRGTGKTSTITGSDSIVVFYSESEHTALRWKF